MKKFLALLLALLLVLSLAACGQNTQNESGDKEKVENTQDTADKKDEKTESTTEKEPDVQKDPAANAEDNNGTAASGETDLTTFSLGVSEDGENVLVTVKNETDVGTVTCVMTFWYDSGKLYKETADYYVPDGETAKVLADELKQDGTIDPASVAVSGICVSCTMKDSELAELQELTHDELVEAMTYAIQAMQ